MGKVQRRILERLQQAGRYQSVHDLACHVYEVDDGAPTRPQLVAVRRAVKRLTDSGMVESGMVARVGYEGRLSCWLPNTLASDDLANRCSGADVEAAILKVLENFDAGRVEEWLRMGSYVRWDDRGQWHNGYVPQGWLIKQAAVIVGATYGAYVHGHFQVAFNRAVRRLVASGTLDGSIRTRDYARGTICNVKAPRPL